MRGGLGGKLVQSIVSLVIVPIRLCGNYGTTPSRTTPTVSVYINSFLCFAGAEHGLSCISYDYS